MFHFPLKQYLASLKIKAMSFNPVHKITTSCYTNRVLSVFLKVMFRPTSHLEFTSSADTCRGMGISSLSEINKTAYRRCAPQRKSHIFRLLYKPTNDLQGLFDQWNLVLPSRY